ncbi:MAG: hypothetical protein JKY19_06475, partial [Alcanivoracaceae bacterium]|nr:hypothetical protein [Alcanivoracaceae bacterium]
MKTLKLTTLIAILTITTALVAQKAKIEHPVTKASTKQTEAKKSKSLQKDWL